MNPTPQSNQEHLRHLTPPPSPVLAGLGTPRIIHEEIVQEGVHRIPDGAGAGSRIGVAIANPLANIDVEEFDFPEGPQLPQAPQPPTTLSRIRNATLSLPNTAWNSLIWSSTAMLRTGNNYLFHPIATGIISVYNNIPTLLTPTPAQILKDMRPEELQQLSLADLQTAKEILANDIQRKLDRQQGSAIKSLPINLVATYAIVIMLLAQQGELRKHSSALELYTMTTRPNGIPSEDLLNSFKKDLRRDLDLTITKMGHKYDLDNLFGEKKEGEEHQDYQQRIYDSIGIENEGLLFRLFDNDIHAQRNIFSIFAQAAPGDIFIATDIAMMMDETSHRWRIKPLDLPGGTFRQIKMEGDALTARLIRPMYIGKYTEAIPTRVLSFQIEVDYETSLEQLKGRPMDEAMSEAIKITSSISNIVKETSGNFQFE